MSRTMYEIDIDVLNPENFRISIEGAEALRKLLPGEISLIKPGEPLSCDPDYIGLYNDGRSIKILVDEVYTSTYDDAVKKWSRSYPDIEFRVECYAYQGDSTGDAGTFVFILHDGTFTDPLFLAETLAESLPCGEEIVRLITLHRSSR